MIKAMFRKIAILLLVSASIVATAAQDNLPITESASALMNELDRLALIGSGRLREHPRGTPKKAPSHNPRAALNSVIEGECLGKMAEKVLVGMSDAQATRCSPLRFQTVLSKVTANVGGRKGTLYIYDDEKTERVYAVDDVITAIHTAHRIAHSDKLRTVGEYPQFYQQPKVVALPNGDYFLMGQDHGERWEEPAQIEMSRLSDFGNRPGRLIEEPPPLHWDATRKGWRKLPKAPVCQGRWYLHTLTVLSEARVLVAGGLCDVGQIANEAKPIPDHNLTAIWNSKTRGWEAGPKIARSRIFHSASLLPNGSVLLVGGRSDPHLSAPHETVLGTAEIITSNSVVTASSLVTARAKHTATVLNDGTVLVIGGVSAAGRSLTSAEKWNPKTGQWHPVAPLKTSRYAHSATLLADGKVLVIGGIDADNELLNTTEIYDPAADQWLAAPPLPVYFQNHTAGLLSDGKVLMIGAGVRQSHLDKPWGYTWVAGQLAWAPVASRHPSGAQAHLHRPTIIPSNNGGATLFGDENVYEWSLSSALRSQNEPNWKSKPIGVALADGRLLVIGSEDGSNNIWLSKLWDPKTNTWSHAGNITALQNQYRSAIQTPMGRVLLVAEGRNGQLQCQLWIIESMSWRDCVAPKNQFAATAAPGMQWLVDRRIAVVANGSEALTFDESTEQWSVHKLDQTTQGLAFGQSISGGDTPLFSFIDSNTGKRFDVSDAGARNWQPQSPIRSHNIVSDGQVIRSVPARSGAPALLWDTNKNRWAYILKRTVMSTDGAFLLSDGCALAWTPFKLLDPSTGAITELENIAGSLSASQTDVVLLKDGTVAILGVSKGRSSTESSLVTQKLSCKGWAKSDNGKVHMTAAVLNEGLIQTEENARLKTNEVIATPLANAPKSRRFESFWYSLKESSTTLLATAALIMTIFAIRMWHIRRKAAAETAKANMAAKLARAKARNAELHRNGNQAIASNGPNTTPQNRLSIAKKTAASKSMETAKNKTKTRGLAWYLSNLLRITAFVFIALFGLNVLSIYILRDKADSDDHCRLNPAQCLSKETKIMVRNPEVPGTSGKAQPRIPCNFVGIWGVRFKGMQLRFELNVDGSYKMDTPVAGEVKNDKGFWVIQGDYMIWRSSINSVRDADINLIFMASPEAFILVETNGIKSEFQRTGTMPNQGCSKT
jgi:hypothetical protein